MRPIATVLLAILGTLPSQAAAQAVFPDANGRALANVMTFDARVRVPTWLEVTLDRDRFLANGTSAFHLALRRDGVIVAQSAPNFLDCVLNVAESSRGAITYVWDVEYYSYETAGVHKLLWTTGGLVNIGKDNFSAESAAKDCSDAFANEWLKWNPRR